MADQAKQSKLPIGVLISGSGTNLQAIIEAIERGDLNAEIRVVISNRAGVQGLERAHKHGLRALVINHRDFASREDFDREILTRLGELGVELVVLAGFMRLFSRVMIEAYPNRVMNIHPALSPMFPGIHGPREALDYGVRVSGCTVFFVTEGMDTGPVIIQAAIPVMDDDDEERLAARIRSEEHRIYPEAIRLYQQGRLEVVGRKVRIKDFSASNTGAIVNPRPQR